MQEKRKYYRLQKEFKLFLARWNFPLKNQKWFEVKSIDIGEGGLRFKSPFKVELKEKLQFKLRVPRLNKFYSGFSKVFSLDIENDFFGIGEVVWIKDKEEVQEVGLKFINVFEDDLKALVNFLKQARE